MPITIFAYSSNQCVKWSDDVIATTVYHYKVKQSVQVILYTSSVQNYYHQLPDNPIGRVLSGKHGYDRVWIQDARCTTCQ